METSPDTLPQLNYGATYAPESNVIRSENAAGPYSARRRFTKAPTIVSGTLTLTTQQVQILDAFVENTLKDVLPFSMIDQRTGAMATYVFTKRPQHTAVEYDNWNTAVEFRAE